MFISTTKKENHIKRKLSQSPIIDNSNNPKIGFLLDTPPTIDDINSLDWITIYLTLERDEHPKSKGIIKIIDFKGDFEEESIHEDKMVVWPMRMS